jgi:Zn-dependent peptidase ImmA (M78 family)
MGAMASPEIQEATQAAEQLLHSTWAPAWPDAVPLPVDPAAIAHQLGVRVYVAQMESDIAGSLVKQPGADPIIYLNSQDARTRQRFTCAHELGHYVQRANKGELEFQFKDERAKLASLGTNADERFANAFAAALLMPEHLVRGHRNLSPMEAALKFGVSTEAMAFRRKNLGIQ